MRLGILGLILLATLPAQAGTITRYTILFQDKPSGVQTTQVADDGTVTVDFSYRNNGRGPDLKEEMAFAQDGTLRRYSGKGTSTYGGPIDESFTREGDKVEWRASSDRGTLTLAGSAAYVPVQPSAEVYARIIRAVALQPGRRLKALPGGELVVEKVLDERVEVGSAVRDLSLYALKGLEEEPSYLWATREPEMKMFASIYPGWSRIIEAGWESVVDKLEGRQIEADNAVLKNLAAKLSHPLPGPTLIRNARVFDSERSTLGPAKDVYINSGRIAAIYEPGSPAQGAAREIDARGRVLLPGLFDMHVHISDWSALQQVAGGVTSVRDLGNDNAFMAGLIQRIANGSIIGPRITPAGFIEGVSPFSAKIGIVVSDLEGVKKAIDWYAQRGYPQIKIYNSFRSEWVPEAVKYAHQRGLRVSGHVPAFMRAEDVVRHGFDEIQHINQVMLNFFVKPTDDTRTLARFNLVAENAHRVDLDSVEVRDFLALLHNRLTLIDPTLVVFEGRFNQLQGEMNQSYAPIADHLPLGTQRGLRTNSMNLTSENVQRTRESYAKMVEFVGAMYRAGIPIVAGTDSMAGFALHRELELYVKAGIPPAEVLRIATWDAAHYTRTLDRAGSITPGKFADLILLEDDPTKDISAIRRINLVMKEGVVYFPAELHEATGIKPFVTPISLEAQRSSPTR